MSAQANAKTNQMLKQDKGSDQNSSSSMPFKEYLALQTQTFNEVLKEFFAPEMQLKQEDVRKAALYSLMLPSKRLRPIFCIESCRAFGGEVSKAYVAAVALECVHTYSLVHDDLPSMDDDEVRRGQPTNHMAFGEARAILAGDGLLTKAFEVLATCSEVSAEIRQAWVSELSRAAGWDGMVLGQDMDMHFPTEPTKELLEALHRKKTGALLAASVTMGALAAGQKPSDLEELRGFAQDMGLAFQIQDDVLDVEGGKEIGKPQKSDLKNQKATYVSLLGLDGAKKEAQFWYDRAISRLKSTSFSQPHRLEELTRFVIDRKL